MASNFLNNLAKKQEEKRKTDTTGAKANNTANNKTNSSSKAASGKASDFLNNLANKQEKERSTKYGNASTVDANTDREQEARNTAFEMLKNKGSIRAINRNMADSISGSVLKEQFTPDKNRMDRSGAFIGGFTEGSGLRSISEALGSNRELLEKYDELGQSHPIASTVGNIAGNIAGMLAIGGTVGKAAGGAVKAAKAQGANNALSKLASNAATFGTFEGIRNLGDVASGEISGGRYARRVATGAAAGVAGTFASGLVGNRIADTLVKKGMQTKFMEYVRSLASNTAFDLADTATRQIASNKEDRLSGKDLGVQIASDFAFSLIDSGIDTYRTTAQNKAAMEAAVSRTRNAYEELLNDSDRLTAREAEARAKIVKDFTETARRSINNHYVAGQQDTVNNFNSALDIIDSAMDSYIEGYNATQNAGTIKTPRIEANNDYDVPGTDNVNPVIPNEPTGNVPSTSIQESTVKQQTEEAVDSAVKIIEAEKEAETSSSSTTQEEVKSSTELAVDMLKAEAENNKTDDLINEGFIMPEDNFRNREGEGFEMSEDSFDITPNELIEQAFEGTKPVTDNTLSESKKNAQPAKEAEVDKGFNKLLELAFDTTRATDDANQDTAVTRPTELSSSADLEGLLNESFNTNEAVTEQTPTSNKMTLEEMFDSYEPTEKVEDDLKDADNNKSTEGKTNSVESSTENIEPKKKSERESIGNRLNATGDTIENGIRYWVTGEDGAFRGHITKTDGNVDNGRTLYESDTFTTREEAVNDVLDVAENNGFIERSRTNSDGVVDTANNEREIIRRAGARFGLRFHKEARDAYINSYNGQDIVDYDEYMSDAYTAGKNGDPIASLSDNEKFNEFFRSNAAAIEAIWQAGYNEFEQANKAKNGGEANANGIQPVLEEVHNGDRMVESDEVRTRPDLRHGDIRPEEDTGDEGRRNTNADASEGREDNAGSVRSTDRSGVRRSGSTGSSEGDQVRDNELRSGRGGRGVLNTSESEKQSDNSKEQTEKEIEETAKEETATKDDVVSQPQPKGSDYSISLDDANIPTTSKARINANIEAINTLKAIMAEGRIATAEEQSVLAKFTGWGGVPNKDLREAESALREVLSDDEFKAAMRSSLDAYYTSPKLINSIYEGLASLGFKGGRLLEPSSGVGRFIGAMPNKLKAGIKAWTAVELDKTTGNIAKLLYPSADVRVQGFEKAKLLNNYMDLVIGNVPFGSIGISDRTYPKVVTSLIHNYFIAKSLDKAREGGIVCLITSSGTMDAQSSDAARIEFSKKADLIGAIRLPNTTFNETGTEVTTDILIFKKRKENTAYSGETFINTVQQTIDNYIPVYVNEYFKNHPEMVLGIPTITTTQYGRRVVTYKPSDNGLSLEDQVVKAFSNIKEKMDYPVIDKHEETIKAIKEATNNKVGTAYKKDGKLYINTNGIEQELVLENRDQDIYSRFIDIRDTARALVNAMLMGSPEKEIAALRKQLNESYDAFTKLYKRGFHDYRVRNVIFADTDYAFVQALEKIDDKKVLKSDIFFKNTISPADTAINIATVEDAVNLVLNDNGYIDIKEVSEAIGKSEAEILDEFEKGSFVYKDENENWIDAETYLSGNVRAKYKTAVELAKHDKSYQKNVDALKDVLPEYLYGKDIVTNIGATWVPVAYYEQFINELLGITTSGDRRIKLSYVSGVGYILNTSQVPSYSLDTVENSRTWGTDKINLIQPTGKRTGEKGLFNLILNSQPLTAYKTIEGKRYVDDKESAARTELSKKLTNEFNNWLWKDKTRTEELEELYNDSMNCFVRPKYNAELIIPGQSGIKLRDHQAKVITRIIRSPYNVIMQHGAGAGKTFATIGAAVKLRQLGMAKKPVICVPKNKIGDWSSDFFKMFPNAKVLIADDITFSKENRKVFVNKIVTTDVDAVIMSHEQIQAVPMSEEYETEFIQKQIDQLELTLQQANDKMTIRQLEDAKARLKAKLEKFQE